MRFFSHLRYLLLFVLLSVGNGVKGGDNTFKIEESRVDSLKNILKNQALAEKRKMEVYRDITQIYAAFDPDSVIVYALKAIKLAQEQKDYITLCGLYNHIGIAYCFKNNYDTAFMYLDRGKELAVKNRLKRAELDVTSLYAFIYVKQGKYNTAIDYYLKCLDMYENNARPVSILLNLSEINRKLSNTETAIRYLKQAEKNCTLLTGDNYNFRIPHVYNEYAYNYSEQGNWDEALRYALKADSIPYHGIINKCYTKGLLATIYLHRSDDDRALQYVEESYGEADLLKDQNLYANAEKILSDVYMAEKRYSEAEAEALKAWQSDSTDIDESRTAVLNIALANIYMQNTEKAVYYLKKYSELNDQYSEKSFQTTISDLSIKYETEKKEMRISSLERQKILSIAIGIAGALLAIIVGVVSWQKIRREQLKKQLIATNAVLEWEEKERKRFAHDLHDGINGMLSAVKFELDTADHLNNIRDKLDECIETVRRTAHGMMPISLERFGMKIALEDHCRSLPNVHFHFFGESKRINKKVETMVYYCAYELVNNSCKYSEAKNINVQLIQSEKHVSLIVQDDGCGFDKESVQRGAGLQNIYNRVAALKGRLDIDTSPGKGTETIIELKVKL